MNKKTDHTFEFTGKEIEYIKSINDDYENQLSPYATKNSQAIRAFGTISDNSVLRSNYAIDVDRIIHCPMFNRGTDKTQVFSFYYNDDITRRSSHIQLVSRIARIIGKALKLNLDLIEAIAIGHDIGHTPFGHKGEEFLSSLYYDNTKKYFNHNVHSVRILMEISPCNLTLQTLDGIISHNGERAFTQYEPADLSSFEELQQIISSCYTEKDAISKLHPSTLEGCVVRISDIVAYLGKDRQDAKRIRLIASDEYDDNSIGKTNTEIINNTIQNIIKNSIGQKYIKMDKEVLECIEQMRKENNSKIYNCDEVAKPYYEIVKPMMEKLFYKLKDDIDQRKFDSPIFQHHLNNSIFGNCYRDHDSRAIISDSNEIVVDYIASMTDDYFVDVFKFMFPNDPLNKKIKYIDYFNERYNKSND